jgi:hypothetical protein
MVLGRNHQQYHANESSNSAKQHLYIALTIPSCKLPELHDKADGESNFRSSEKPSSND